MPYKDHEKQKAYQRDWSKKKDQGYRIVAIDMLGGKCVRCSIKDYRVLEIDHITPILRKVVGIDSGTRLARDVVKGKIDISLVQLLCANCHTIKTYHE